MWFALLFATFPRSQIVTSTRLPRISTLNTLKNCMPDTKITHMNVIAPMLSNSISNLNTLSIPLFSPTLTMRTRSCHTKHLMPPLYATPSQNLLSSSIRTRTRLKTTSTRTLSRTVCLLILTIVFPPILTLTFSHQLKRKFRISHIKIQTKSIMLPLHLYLTLMDIPYVRS